MEHPQILIARALMVTFEYESFTTSNLIAHSIKLGITIDRKAFNNNLTAHRDFFEINSEPNIRSSSKRYKFKPSFFKRFIGEKEIYLEILPDHKDIIEKRFEGIEPEKEATPRRVVATNSQIVKSGIAPAMIYRAILTAFEGTFTGPQIVKIAKDYGYELRLDTTGHFLRTNEGKYTNRIGNTGNIPVYEVTEKFLEWQIEERAFDHFVEILPDRRNAIIKRLGLEEGDIKPVEVKSSAPKPKQPEHITPKLIYGAILTAYKKPLSAFDIIQIAGKRGYKVQLATIGHFFRKNQDMVKYEGKGTYGRMTYTVKRAFLSVNRHKIENYIALLPDKKEDIIKRFELLDPVKVEVKPIEPELTGPDQSILEPSENENGDIHSAESEQDFEAQDVEKYIDAANVGRAILSYIERLKSAKPQSVKDQDALQAKYSDAQQTIINQKNEINGLNYQIDKLKRMVEDNNDKLIKLTHELSRFKNENMPENKPDSGKFKMSEVARMATLIKSPRSVVPR